MEGRVGTKVLTGVEKKTFESTVRELKPPSWKGDHHSALVEINVFLCHSVLLLFPLFNLRNNCPQLQKANISIVLFHLLLGLPV